MSVNQLDRKQLLQKASELGIKGRTTLDTETLRARIVALSAEEFEPSKDITVRVKQRHPSRRHRDDDGKVVRKGHNLSGNKPFQGKFYYLNPKVADETKWTAEYKLAEGAAPMQVRLILKYMRLAKLTLPETSLQGGSIVAGAINSNLLKTSIAPPNLFAYYRRVLETLGVIWNKDFTGDEDDFEGEEEDDTES